MTSIASSAPWAAPPPGASWSRSSVGAHRFRGSRASPAPRRSRSRASRSRSRGCARTVRSSRNSDAGWTPAPFRSASVRTSGADPTSVVKVYNAARQKRTAKAFRPATSSCPHQLLASARDRRRRKSGAAIGRGVVSAERAAAKAAPPASARTDFLNSRGHRRLVDPPGFEPGTGRLKVGRSTVELGILWQPGLLPGAARTD